MTDWWYCIPELEVAERVRQTLGFRVSPDYTSDEWDHLRWRYPRAANWSGWGGDQHEDD